MNTHLIRIKSNKPLTHKQRSRLYEGLKQLLNGEGSQFWEEDDVEVVPTLVVVEPMGVEGKLKLYTVSFKYTMPYGAVRQPMPTEQRVLYCGLNEREAQRIMNEHNRGKSWDHEQYARLQETELDA